MDTETYNKEHAHNKEIIDKTLPAKWIDMLENGIDFDIDAISLVCIKFSIFCSVYTNHSIVADQQLV